jgi:signal transduction histidine kinase
MISFADTLHESRDHRGLSRLSEMLIVEFATAPDVRRGMTRVVSRVHTDGGAERVEWWRPSEDNSRLWLAAADGNREGARLGFPLGPAGALVVSGRHCSPALDLAVARLIPVLRRRWTDEHLALETQRLARRNEALDDFVGLVAHELKSPLHVARLFGDPLVGIDRALVLVDSVLEASRVESDAGTSARVGECLADALRDLGPIAADVASNVTHICPLPQPVLRILLRNLLSNALAAGARRVDISAIVSGKCWTLVVDDDGVGVESADGYAIGSKIGLGLCRRLAARFGGAVELRPRSSGGTRATLTLARSAA